MEGHETVPQIVLASVSPRRRRLLELIGIAHSVQDSLVEERPQAGESATAFALRAALDKARAVASTGVDLPVLGSDTVVELDGRILGKPSSTADAETMLAGLADQTHHVHTAVALVADGREASLLDTAVVRFGPLTETQIRWYVATGEPMDKAGAYAIQGCGGLFVRSIEGSPHTVVGLPIHRLDELFSACGLELWGMLG